MGRKLTLAFGRKADLQRNIEARQREAAFRAILALARKTIASL